jgi:hypothetical protein
MFTHSPHAGYNTYQQPYHARAGLNIAASVVPDFNEVPRLCIPFAETGGFWYVNRNTAANCTALDAVEASYRDLVCETPIAPSETPSTSVAFQVRRFAH